MAKYDLVITDGKIDFLKLRNLLLEKCIEKGIEDISKFVQVLEEKNWYLNYKLEDFVPDLMYEVGIWEEGLAFALINTHPSILGYKAPYNESSKDRLWELTLRAFGFEFPLKEVEKTDHKAKEALARAKKG